MDALRTRLEHAVAGRYRVERELGRGGMAVVYLALDLKHGRPVALKVLKPELVPAQGAERFLREIEIAARLTHPNILALHESGEAEGLLYYVMPFLEGETLRERLRRVKQLPIEEAIQVARQVADALGYAHSYGIVHRDIKPENILFQAGHAIVSDFGVARAVSQATGAFGGSVTESGLAIGTLAYMSPEQAAGRRDIDGRSDLYSLGCVLYEMLAGEAPLSSGGIATSVQSLSGELRTVRGSVPPRLADTIAKALARNPADRFPTAAQFTEALSQAAGTAPATVPRFPAPPHPRRVATIAGGAAVLCLLAGGAWWWRTWTEASASRLRSIAVLPLENTSGDTTFAYLEDGVADHVRDALDAVPELLVKARSSSRQLRGQSPPAVAAALDVGAVLQGTVSRMGDRLHVTAELVRTADDAQLWSRTFDGPATDLTAMQDTIASDVTRALHVRSGGRPSAAARRGTTDVQAYDSFLRGRSAFDRQEFPQAIIFFRDAVARDPRFARAQGYLAMSYGNLPVLGIGPLDSVFALARSTAARALAIDSTVVEPYIAQSYALLGDMRFGEALTPLARAMEMDSSDALLLTSYGLTLAQAGRLSDALIQTRRAYQRDPLSIMVIGVYGYVLGLAGRWQEAISASRAALRLDPRGVLLYRTLGFQFAFAGLPDSAVAAFEAGIRIDSTSFGGRSSVVFGYAAAGRWREVERARPFIDRGPAAGARNYNQAVEHLVDGDYGAALTSLERGVDAREQYLGVISVPCDPLFDPLKADPRFADLMRRTGARACPATVAWPIRRAPGRDERP